MCLITESQTALVIANYDPKTRRIYQGWIRRFLNYWHQPEPAALDTIAARGFLQHLATQRKVAPATYNQARQALRFLYENVLRKGVRLPARLRHRLCHRRACQYLTRQELAMLHQQLTPEMALIVGLMRDGGLRAGECLQLRIRDLDFAHQRIHIRCEEGHDLRSANMPLAAVPQLRNHLQNRQAVWREDRRCRGGLAAIPASLAKNHPERARLWPWQHLFSDPRLITMPAFSHPCRGPMQPFRLRTAIRDTAQKLGLADQLHPDDIRHSAAVHMLQDGCPIRTLKRFLGHHHFLTTLLLTARMNPGTPSLLLAGDPF